jgi:hypothetical protein
VKTKWLLGLTTVNGIFLSMSIVWRKHVAVRFNAISYL